VLTSKTLLASSYVDIWRAREESSLQDSHHKGEKTIMIVKTPGSQMGSLTAAEEGGKARGRGRGEREERSKSALESTGPTARSRSREDTAMHEAPDDFFESVIEVTVVGIVVIVTRKMAGNMNRFNESAHGCLLRDANCLGL